MSKLKTLDNEQLCRAIKLIASRLLQSEQTQDVHSGRIESLESRLEKLEVENADLVEDKMMGHPDTQFVTLSPDGKKGISTLWLISEILKDGNLTPGEKILKLTLAFRFFNIRTAQLNPTIKSLAVEMKTNSRRINRLLEGLKRKGEMIVIGKGRFANHYFLPETLHYLDQLDDLKQDPDDYGIKSKP